MMMAHKVAPALALSLLAAACGDQPAGPVAPTPDAPDAAANDVADAEDPASKPTLGDAELRRLTRLELVRSLRHVLGPVTVEETEPDLYQAGFAKVGAGKVATSSSGVERYSYAIEAALDQVFADPAHKAALIGCEAAGLSGEACVDDFIRRVGQRAWRRPLTNAQLERYRALQAECLGATSDFDLSLRCVASALLHSPWFLYRIELPRDGVFEGYDMASRLAYFLWGAPPDLALLQAAYAGELDTAEGVRSHAARMLESPRAREGLSAFVDEWYRLDRLDRLERDVLALTHEPLQFALGKEGQLQPWLAWIAEAAREELRRMVVGHVFDDDRDYLDLLITDRTWVDPQLQAIYELPFDDEGIEQVGSGETNAEAQLVLDGPPDDRGFARAHHTEASPRRGVIGTMAILAQLGKQNETSPTRRGLYVMEHILCLEVGQPPDDIDLCERPEGVSRRESMEAHHLCAPACTGCHSQMDPLGFALDGFDTIGRQRASDDWGYPLDTAVEYHLVSGGQTTKLSFDSLRTMADTFYGLPEATSCVTRQIYRYATGRDEHEGDPAVIDALNEAFVDGGRRMKGFMIHLVGTDAFRKPAAGVELPDTGAPLTLSQLANDVFAKRCAPCHVGGSALGGLDLSDDEGLLERLSAASTALPSMPLVTPGDPSRSYLWHKVSGTHLDVGGSGTPMPPGGDLSNDDTTLIRQWIEVTP